MNHNFSVKVVSMHISEGILSGPVLAVGWAGCLGLTAVSLKKTAFESVPRVALMAAVLFLASLVHVPVWPAKAHLMLAGLTVVFLGWSAVLAVFLALLLQAILFQFGGVISLGPNVFNASAPALLVGMMLRGRLIRRGFISMVSGFLVGFGCVLGTSALLFCSLYVSDPNLAGTALLGASANTIAGIVEGVVTALALAWISKNVPEVLWQKHSIFE